MAYSEPAGRCRVRSACVVVLFVIAGALVAEPGADQKSTSESATRSATASTPVRISFDGRLKRDPVFWPGTGDLVYTVESIKTARMQLVRRALPGGKPVPFAGKAEHSDRELTVSRDGSVYAYNVVRGLSSSIVVVDTKRDLRITMPNMGRASWTNWPSLSPDGTRLVFSEGAAVIYSYDLVANKGKASVTRLSPAGAEASVSDYWPRFSPDGESIVFTSNRDSDFEIYVMRTDGTEQRRLTRSRGIDMRPTYSPDGESIAFTSNRDGNYEVYVMGADGSRPLRLTDHPERDDYACWHPDGRRLVIVSERDGEFDLYLLDASKA